MSHTASPPIATLIVLSIGDIDGVPDDLRMVHVSQEIDGTDTSVLLSVMSCDYELLETKKEEQRLLKDPNADPDELQQCMEKLDLLPNFMHSQLHECIHVNKFNL